MPLTQRSTRTARTACTARRVDNNFATNHWVYLYYSPQTVDGHQLLRRDDGRHATTSTRLRPIEQRAARPRRRHLRRGTPGSGYFQLSRFKFVDDAPGDAGAPRPGDRSSRSSRVPNNRGACCHVAGDIDFDKHNNLWVVTGDDSAGRRRRRRRLRVRASTSGPTRTRRSASTNATGGTFTLTFNGPDDGSARRSTPLPRRSTSALEALSNIGTGNIQATGGPVNTANVTRHLEGHVRGAERRRQLTSDATGLTGTTPTVTIGDGTGAAAATPLVRAASGDAGGRRGRSALNTNDLRGKILRIKVKDGDITPAEANKANFGAAARTRSRPGTCSRSSAGAPQAEDEARGLRDGLPEPVPDPGRRERRRVRQRLLAGLADAAAVPRRPRAPAASRSSASRRTTAGRSAIKPTCRYYPWNVNLQVPMNLDDHQPVPAGQTPQPYPCDAPRRQQRLLEPQRRPERRARPGDIPPITDAGHLVLVQRQQRGEPAGDAVLRLLRAGRADRSRPHRARRPRARACSRSCTRAASGPHGIAKYKYDPANPNPLKFPPYYDELGHPRRVHPGHPARAQARLAEPRVQDQLVPALRCRRTWPTRRSRSSATTRWTCSGAPTATSTCSPTATGSSTSTPTPACTSGSTSRARGHPGRRAHDRQDRRPAAADGQVLERRLERRRSGRLDHVRVGLRRRHARTRSTRTRRTPTRRAGRYTAVLTVTDSSGKTDLGEHGDHGRQHVARRWS